MAHDIVIRGGQLVDGMHDFPGDAPRFIQRSKGYRATLVNGRINVRNGERTGVRAGKVLRHRA